MVLSFLLLLFVWLLPSESKFVYEQRYQSQMLKFLASLFVVLGHETFFYTNLPQIVVNETSTGSLCVAFFLFMSGYGLLYGFVAKSQRLDVEWICKRLLKLAVPALTAMAIYLMVEMLVGKDIDWNCVLKYWFVSDKNLRYGWYVTEILVLYVSFWLCFRFLSKRRAFLMMFMAALVTMAVMIACKSNRWYIQSVPAFLLGMAMARCDLEHGSHWRLHVKMGKKLLASVVVIAFCLLKNFHKVQAVVPALDMWRYEYTAFYICDFAFVIVVVYLLKRLPVCKSMVNRGGGISMRFILYRGQHYSFAGI